MKDKNMKTITLKSKGLTGEEYVEHLEKEGFEVSSWAKDISKQVTKTKKGNKYEIVIMKHEEFNKEYVTTQEVRDEAKKRGYITPSPEVAYLLREELTDKDIEDMGLWWLTVLHEPITGSDGDPFVLGLNRHDDGRWLYAFDGRPADRWFRENGFVFLSPQVSELGTKFSELSALSLLELRLKKLEEWAINLGMK